MRLFDFIESRYFARTTPRCRPLAKVAIVLVAVFFCRGAGAQEQSVELTPAAVKAASEPSAIPQFEDALVSRSEATSAAEPIVDSPEKGSLAK